jgi:hypothetical protein
MDFRIGATQHPSGELVQKSTFARFLEFFDFRLFQQYLPEAEVGPARLTPQHERELRAAFAIYLGNPDQDDRPVSPAPQLYRVQSW